MSKRVEATIKCPSCSHHFGFTLYRSIWGEYPVNRELVMRNEINVATCPSCQAKLKLPFAFIYTNADKQFAVWWEPAFDPEIDQDTKGYARMLGAGNYLAAAPRVQDWEEFKATIQRFERGELRAKPPVMSKEMEGHMDGFLKHLQKGGQKKNASGCLGVAVLLASSIGLSIFFTVLYLIS